MLKIAPLLSGPGKGQEGITFDLVIPSLVGYGFPDASHEPGMSVSKMAGIFHELMAGVLAYDKYALRGGDLGAGIALQMALLYPEYVIGLHTGGTYPRIIGELPDDLTAAEKAYIENVRAWMQTEAAYAQVHATKPQTLASALNDSPAGLAAWIVEKFRKWSDCGGDVEKRFTKDELLTNLTIYWATQTINSSMRLYYETVRNPGIWGRIKVPTAALMPMKDMFPTPRE
jgi:pimeloyl-ACP methyl ester carboxylesterase